MIDKLTNGGPIDVMRAMMEFAAARQKIISHNLANASTPGFRPVDVSVGSFQDQLGAAIDRRRSAQGGMGDLKIEDSAEVMFNQGRGQGVLLNPSPVGDGLLLHDGNDRSMEHILQDLVENFLAFRTASQLYRKEIETLQMAIRERI